jgi:hypothetical protein
MARSNTRSTISVRYIERADPCVGSAGTLVYSRAMAQRGSGTSADGAVVEYGLVRRALLLAVAQGTVGKGDVCDAHPELVRAATHLGRPSGERCPICEASDLVEVTYVFGAKLPPGGACPSTRAELGRLERREEPVQCYAVEVCTSCHFHHLVRKWLAGGRPARATKASR